MQRSSLAVRLVLVGTVSCCIIGMIAIFASRAHTSYTNDFQSAPTVTAQTKKSAAAFVISHSPQSTSIQGVPAVSSHADGT